MHDHLETNPKKLKLLIQRRSFFSYKVKYRKSLLVTGLTPFSNANIYALDQLIPETRTVIKSSTSPLLSVILHWIIKRPYKKLFSFEN
jgi:hypothetical protein